MRHRTLLAALALLAAAGTGFAQGYDWQIGGRGVFIAGGTPSAAVGDTGTLLDLDNGGGLEVNAWLMFSERFGAELSLGGVSQQLHAVGGSTCCGGVDAGRVWLLPLAVLAQYHQPVYGNWDPYVGVGVAWAAPIFSESQELEGAGIVQLDLDGNPGIAVQIGANYDLDNRWYANLDLRYLGVTLDARVRLEDGDAPPVTLDIKPWVFGIGFGYRF